MNKRDRNGNSSAVATVLRDGPDVPRRVHVTSDLVAVRSLPRATAATLHVDVRVLPCQPAYVLIEHRRGACFELPGVQSELVIIAALGRRHRTFPNHLPGWIAGMKLTHGYAQLMP